MRSVPVGAVVAAIVMFALGFVLFGLVDITRFMVGPIDPATAASVQGALGGMLPETGTYAVPMDEEAWMRGPSAVILYVAAGGAPDMTVAMAMGYVHFLLVALLLGYGLKAVGGDFGRQARVLLWFVFAATVFMHLGDPIWFGFAWRAHVIELAADAFMMLAGGLVLARWFTSERSAAA
jgi:hypothetical protein